MGGVQTDEALGEGIRQRVGQVVNVLRSEEADGVGIDGGRMSFFLFFLNVDISRVLAIVLPFLLLECCYFSGLGDLNCWWVFF